MVERWGTVVVTLVALVALSACGGGGGGGGGNPNPPRGDGVQFSLSPTSVSVDYFENESNRPTLNTTATAVGTLPDTLYIGAVDEGTAIDPAIQAYINGTQATFVATPKAGLAAGTYTNRIRLMACRDQNCNSQVGNSPLYLSYIVRVKQDLKVAPATNEFSAVSGINIDQVFMVQVPDGSTTYTVNALSNGEACSVTDQTANSVRMIGRSQPSGTYNCTLVFSSGTRALNRLLTLHFDPPPGGDRNLALDTTQMTFAMAEGASSGKQLGVTPASWDPRHTANISYYGDATGWLSTVANQAGYAVIADAAALSAGTYYATVSVGGQQPISGQSVSIALTVGPGLVRPANRTHTVSSDTVAGDLAAAVPVTLVEGPTVNFSASSNADWLKLPTATGQTGGSLAYSFDTPEFRALPNGKLYEAWVTINTSRPNITPVTFAVTVDKRIAQVTGLGPYLHTAGQPIRAYVRGVGFSAVNSMAQRLQVAGAASPSVTTVNDTTLLMTLPSQGSGTYEVSASNQLGLTTPKRTLKVIAPAPMTYAALPTGQIPGTIFYDAERQNLYWIGRDYSLHWYKRSGSNWVEQSHSLNGIANMGLSSDGAHIIVNGNGLRFLDAETLVETSNPHWDGHGVGVGWEFGRQIPVTNDGRVWFITNSIINDSYVGYFDPLSGSFGQVRAYFDDRYPVTMELARDGELLRITDQWAVTVLRSSRVEEGLDLLSLGFGRPPVKTSSDDGNRVVWANYLSGNDIRTQPFGNADTTIYEASGHTRASLAPVVSPNGQRLYVLTYHTRDYFNEEDPLPPPFAPPRVYVLDATVDAQQPNDLLPIIGYFELADFPTCRYVGQCGLTTLGGISPDGLTLFFAGSEKLLVVPIPPEDELQSVAGRGRAAPAVGSMYRWR